MNYPWEQTHELTTVEVAEIHAPATIETVVTALQRDFAYAVAHTAVLVHSSHDELRILVNTARGQIIPRGECKLSDGTTIEFQDVGMPQVGAPLMTVKELLGRVWTIVAKLDLGVLP